MSGGLAFPTGGNGHEGHPAAVTHFSPQFAT